MGKYMENAIESVVRGINRLNAKSYRSRFKKDSNEEVYQVILECPATEDEFYGLTSKTSGYRSKKGIIPIKCHLSKLEMHVATYDSSRKVLLDYLPGQQYAKIRKSQNNTHFRDISRVELRYKHSSTHSADLENKIE